MMRLWDQLGGAGLGRAGGNDEWSPRYPEATAWWHGNRHGGHDPNHSTPYLDLILPPCAVICFLISMYAVLGIGLDWHSGNWRGDLLILLLAVGLPLVLAALPLAALARLTTHNRTCAHPRGAGGKHPGGCLTSSGRRSGEISSTSLKAGLRRQ